MNGLVAALTKLKFHIGQAYDFWFPHNLCSPSLKKKVTIKIG